MIVFLVGINIAAINSTGYVCSILDTGVPGSGTARESYRAFIALMGHKANTTA